ncbi:hypothetical protein [Prevotella denticola]|uniref:hypothetical protein n=1 Tax=Prevotella denticola TaxID=28129 RepID=UPI001C5D10C4|nr:hypothetical protein [Prevotella denticola]MBF1388406.1 hypothetical protein [Prevotella denticola]MBW4898610.1 hypothetical protein [Prevotella denticola]
MSPLAGHEGKAILGKRVPTGREQEFQLSGTRIPGIGNRGTNRREFPTHADDVFGKQPERISRTPFFAPSVLSAALVFIVVQYYRLPVSCLIR